MRRVFITAAVVLFCCTTLLAQRGAVGTPASSLRVFPGGIPPAAGRFCCGREFQRPFPRFRGPHFFPPVFFISGVDEYDYEAPYTEPVVVRTPVIIREKAEQNSVPAKQQELSFSPGAKMIEIAPALSGRAMSQSSAATVFILKNGQTIESQRYTITPDAVVINTSPRQSARFNLDEVNVPATMEANRRRGIELRLPTAVGEFFLSY